MLQLSTSLIHKEECRHTGMWTKRNLLSVHSDPLCSELIGWELVIYMIGEMDVRVGKELCAKNHFECSQLLCGLQYFLNNMWLAIKKGTKTDLKAGLVFQEIFSYIKASSVQIICTILRHMLCTSWQTYVATQILRWASSLSTYASFRLYTCLLDWDVQFA